MSQTITVSVELKNDTELSAFGAYIAGSARDGTAEIAINFDAIFHSVSDPANGIPACDWKGIAADIVVHELLHAVEDMLGKAFSEVDVEGAIERARTNPQAPPPEADDE